MQGFRGPFQGLAGLPSEMKALMDEPTSPRQLVAEAQKGNRSAFDRLVGTYEGRVSQFIASRIKLHLGPRIDLDEIRQETFTRAYESIARFLWQGEDSLFQWLCGIAKHVLMKAAEKSRKNEQIERTLGLRASSPSPSKVLRRDERLARLQRSIDALPLDYRRVIELARMEGLKIEEIAERLGKSRDSVKHLLARALASLRAGFGHTESLHLPDRALRFDGEDHVEG
jgi:RNA polymerase sigma-70 factor, ECF subfamily